MLPVKSRARINSRRKGAVFERRVALFLSEKLGGKIERNLGQSRRAGVDLVSAPTSTIRLDDWAIECKTAQQSAIPTWWRQTRANAGTRRPVLVYKVRRGAPLWLFRTTDAPNRLWIDTYTIGGEQVAVLNSVSAVEVLKSIKVD